MTTPAPNDGYPNAVTTVELLQSAATRHGSRPFIVDGADVLSFTDTLNRARELGIALRHDGFQKGGRAAIWAPNSWQWIVAALGVHWAGGTLVTLNTRYKGAEAAAILRASGADTLFVVDHFLGVDYPAQLAGEDCPALTRVITMVNGPAGHAIGPSTAEPQSLAATLAKGAELLRSNDPSISRHPTAIDADTSSDILFTSGTTGRAKGVMTCHGQNLRAFTSFATILGLDSSDRYLIINPFFHSFGYKAGWLAALIAGATVYPLAVFDVPTVLDTIRREQITVMPGPPTLFQSILAQPELDVTALQSLTKATTGAATIPTQLIVAMRDTLGISVVLTAYGLSESCGLVSICRADDSAETIAQTSGRAIPDIELAIMSSTGGLLGPDESGEIVVRGYNVMQGYLDNPEATAETIDSHGWLHTGDIGSLDEAGNLRITDRLKDMYICGGFNCYPAEIEQQLLDHPAIAQAAVVGTPDQRMGEVGAAFVILKPGQDIAADDLLAWCREHMANYKVPRHLQVIDALPLNASGKVLKTELRQRLSADSSQS